MSAPARDLEAEVAAIKAQHDAAVRNRIRAEQQHDTAKARAETLLQQLQADFGVSTYDDAKALLDTLTAELAAAIAEARQRLSEAGS